ncbi:MAG: AhpC/TSA family protein [Vicinamibacterales bacterium]
MGHPLEQLTVFDTAGRAVRLDTLWTHQPVVLLFVRHFGCLFCRQQIAEMQPAVPRIRAAGAELYVIGNGSVEEARAFEEELQPGVGLLTDPTRQTFCALQMRSGLATVLRPSVLWRSLRALRAGFTQTRVAGDPFQQGGVVVIGPGGLERYRYVSRTAGDHPDPGKVLAAVERAA